MLIKLTEDDQCSRQNRQYQQIAGWGSQVPVEGRKTAYIAGCSGH